MEIKVKNLYLKTSPRKLQPVLLKYRGQNAESARTSLLFTNKKGAKMFASLITSGLAVAKENDLETEKFIIKAVYCNEGPRLKRRQIKARGRSDAIIKRMSHLTLVLTDGAIEAEKTEKKEDVNKEKKTEIKKSES